MNVESHKRVAKMVDDDEFDYLFKGTKELPFSFNQRTFITRGFGQRFRIYIPKVFSDTLRYKARKSGVNLDDIQFRYMPLMFELKGFYANDQWHKITDLKI